MPSAFEGAPAESKGKKRASAVPGTVKEKKPRGSVWFLTAAGGGADPFVAEGLRERFATLYTFTAASASAASAAASTATGEPEGVVVGKRGGGKKERERAEKKARKEQAKRDKEAAAAAAAAGGSKSAAMPPPPPPPPTPLPTPGPTLKIKLKMSSATVQPATATAAAAPKPAAAAKGKPAASTADDDDSEFSSSDEEDEEDVGESGSDAESDAESDEDATESDEDGDELDVDDAGPSGTPRGLPPVPAGRTEPKGPPPPTPMEVLAALGSPRGGRQASSALSGPLSLGHHRRPAELDLLALGGPDGPSPDKRRRTNDDGGSVRSSSSSSTAAAAAVHRPLMLSLLPANTRMTLSFPAVLSPTASPSVPPYGLPTFGSSASGGGPGGRNAADGYFPHSTPSRLGSPASNAPLLLASTDGTRSPVVRAPHDGEIEIVDHDGSGPPTADVDDDDTAFPLHLALLGSFKGSSPYGPSALDRSYREGTFDDDYVDAVSVCEPYFDGGVGAGGGNGEGGGQGELSPPFEEGYASSPEAEPAPTAVEGSVAKAERWALGVAAADGHELAGSPLLNGGGGDDGASAGSDVDGLSDGGHASAAAAAAAAAGLMDEDFLGPESVGLEELERAWGGAAKGKKRKRPSVGPPAVGGGSPLSDDVVMHDSHGAGGFSSDDGDGDEDDDEADDDDDPAQHEMRRQKEAFAQALVERARSATAVMICPDLSPTDGPSGQHGTDDDDEMADDDVSRARATKHRRTSSLPKPLPAPPARKEPSPLSSAPIGAASLGAGAGGKRDVVVVGDLHLRDLVCDAELDGLDDEDDDEHAVEQSVLPATATAAAAPSPPPQPVASPVAFAPTSSGSSSAPSPALGPATSLPASRAPPAAPPAGTRPTVARPPAPAPAPAPQAARDPPPPHPVFARPGQAAAAPSSSAPPAAAAARAPPPAAQPRQLAASAPASLASTPAALPVARPYQIIYSSVPLLPEPAKVMSTTVCGGASLPSSLSLPCHRLRPCRAPVLTRSPSAWPRPRSPRLLRQDRLAVPDGRPGRVHAPGPPNGQRRRQPVAARTPAPALPGRAPRRGRRRPPAAGRSCWLAHRRRVGQGGRVHEWRLGVARRCKGHRGLVPGASLFTPLTPSCVEADPLALRSIARSISRCSRRPRLPSPSCFGPTCGPSSPRCVHVALASLPRGHLRPI